MSRTANSSVPVVFYKYTSPDTTLVVLRNRTFRYSSPLLFNDPFDFQPGDQFDFDISDLPSKILDRLELIASSKKEPEFDTKNPWGELARIVWRLYPNHGFPRRRFEQYVEPWLSIFAEKLQKDHQTYREQWLNDFLPRVRVFCVSEERDNLLMWAHYAKDHTGAVFEVRSLPLEDNPISVAEPVVYHDSLPPFFTEKEWFDQVFGIKELNDTVLQKRYAYAKSSHWQYEREWRVWYPQNPAPDSLSDDLLIRPNEISALYFGCRATDSFISEATGLAQDTFPSCRFYRAHRSKDTYELTYDQI